MQRKQIDLEAGVAEEDRREDTDLRWRHERAHPLYPRQQALRRELAQRAVHGHARHLERLHQLAHRWPPR